VATDAKDSDSVGPFSFIRDQPAVDDSFGAHTRLASVVAELLKNQEQAQVIGILGPWGSGKSTAVKQIENAVGANDSAKTHFFTYDAWLHQADPVRRSFLEALVKFLVSKRRADHDEWEKKIEELNSSVEKTESETAPVLSHSGKWLIASLALVPLGLSLVGYDAFEDAVANRPSTWAALFLLTGVVLCLAPAMTAFGLYVAWRPWTNPFSRKLWKSFFRAISGLHTGSRTSRSQFSGFYPAAWLIAH
jgi:hypothetical protein